MSSRAVDENVEVAADGTSVPRVPSTGVQALVGAQHTSTPVPEDEDRMSIDGDQARATVAAGVSPRLQAPVRSSPELRFASTASPPPNLQRTPSERADSQRANSQATASQREVSPSMSSQRAVTPGTVTQWHVQVGAPAAPLPWPASGTSLVFEGFCTRFGVSREFLRTRFDETGMNIDADGDVQEVLNWTMDEQMAFLTVDVGMPAYLARCMVHRLYGIVDQGLVSRLSPARILLTVLMFA